MKIIERFVRNKSNRPRNTQVTCIVVHATGVGTVEGAISWFNNPESEVSAHYIIDVDGTIYYCVEEEKKAWHAGASKFLGKENVNNFSIGIELHNIGGLYPSVQLDALVELCASIFSRHPGIHSDWVVSHAEVALPKGRKTDPERFDWPLFKSKLKLAIAKVEVPNGV